MSAVLGVREQSARYLEAVPQRLVRQFDLLATAQGGVARLRELIVLLALQGKLVEQDPQEASVLDWLAKIQADRDALSANGQGKATKSFPLVEDCERWFDLPAAWTWVRLNDLVTSSEAGWSPSCPETPRRGERWGVLKVSAVSWGRFDPTANKELPEELAPRPEYEVRSGDFLLSRANTAELVARSVVVGEAPPRLMLSDKVIRLTFAKGVNRAFINLCNNSSAARSYYAAKASGTSSSMKNVSREVVLGLPVPIPPIHEQARIVARVDELMRLCDALEAKGRLEAEEHARLLGTLLGTLTDSGTPEELAANWQRVADHFDLLLDRPEAVDALEQTIVQLAVRGLLVPQVPSDEPATALLDQARILGNCLNAKPASMRGLPAGEPQVDQEFRTPSGWEWVCLADLLPEFQNGVASRGDTGGRQITVLRLADIKARRVSLADTRQIPIAERDIEKYRLRSGDILITRVNGSADIVGQFNLCEEDVDGIYCDHFIRLRVRTDWLDPAFAALLGESDLIRNRIRGLFITTAGQKTVNQGHIGSLRFALPPRAEQIRIVTRVTQLRRLCAELRQRLTASQTTQSHLAEALIAEVA